MDKICKLLKRNNLNKNKLAKIMKRSAHCVGRVLNEKTAVSKDFRKRMNKALKEFLECYKEKKAQEIESLVNDFKKIEDELDKALLEARPNSDHGTIKTDSDTVNLKNAPITKLRRLRKISPTLPVKELTQLSK